MARFKPYGHPLRPMSTDWRPAGWEGWDAPDGLDPPDKGNPHDLWQVLSARGFSSEEIQVIHLRLDGLWGREIAEVMGYKSRTTVYALLRSVQAKYLDILPSDGEDVSGDEEWLEPKQN